MSTGAVLFAIGVGLILLTTAVLAATTPTVSPAPPAPCPHPPGPSQSIGLRAGQTEFSASFGLNGGNSNSTQTVLPFDFTLWTNSSATYALYLLDQDQYHSVTGLYIGTVGSPINGPPAVYTWTSGLVNRSIYTGIFGDGDGSWTFGYYDPGTAPANLTFQAASCSAM